mmetsp:Transcript_7243/g.13504  ORF Transcript_7243/g.13504 Transcript_7243/m.13504 type:complete len:181 (+) Transcript_7243:130-672(+)|eukprot:CAMPEP_0201676848 /NCGR_PEP_ID=MMETSP0494-20130426/42731_1 /ASSEMBLY_ACC=CAM_ASM_000839 /TAXON_ID=420259 /ORGANISM="Thalassiosira gravida, Strain GMp14c1" /LENGTH=180 /DNA_ID=CAMNT_0048159647 /DNA_START=111 /DNA_END=653 /DNA_ORIENTATION=-
MSSSDRQSRRATKYRLHFSRLSILISSVFWIWAIVNTTESGGSFDLGTVSFLSVLVAHTVILRTLRKQRQQRQHQQQRRTSNNDDGLQQQQEEEEEDDDNEQTLQPSSKCASYAILGTHLFVTLNYLLGLSITIVAADTIDNDVDVDDDRRMIFAIYCGIATVLWFGSAIVGCRLFKPEL